MMSLVAWYESIDPAGALVPIAGVSDPHVFVSGDDIRVPQEMPNIIGEAGLANDATAVRAQVQAPSLRAIVNLDIEPVVAAAVFGSAPEGIWHPMSPVPLDAFESMTFHHESNPVAVVDHYGLVWLSDGAQAPTPGRIFTVRATAAITLAAGTWVNGALTFTQTLPVGTYDIVGMRARGTNLVAARLVFVGAFNRPGVAAVNALGDRDPIAMRHGRMGIFGRFHTNTPPTIDALGITDTAQTVHLDIVRVG